MRNRFSFPYRVFNRFPSPIIPLGLFYKEGWLETEAYVDSGATFSIFSTGEAGRIGLDYMQGRKIFSMVGDGNLIPVFLHRIPVKIGTALLKATIGFSPRLGVGFNLIGRKDFFAAFDITFSDSSQTITFIPQK